MGRLNRIARVGIWNEGKPPAGMRISPAVRAGDLYRVTFKLEGRDYNVYVEPILVRTMNDEYLGSHIGLILSLKRGV